MLIRQLPRRSLQGTTRIRVHRVRLRRTFPTAKHQIRRQMNQPIQKVLNLFRNRHIIQKEKRKSLNQTATQEDDINNPSKIPKKRKSIPQEHKETTNDPIPTNKENQGTLTNVEKGPPHSYLKNNNNKYFRHHFRW